MYYFTLLSRSLNLFIKRSTLQGGTDVWKVV